jgi:hypothetical protein
VSKEKSVGTEGQRAPANKNPHPERRNQRSAWKGGASAPAYGTPEKNVETGGNSREKRERRGGRRCEM